MEQNTIIKIKCGIEENLPELSDGELAYTKDKNNLYIGTSEGNKKIGKAFALEGSESEDQG